MFGALTAIPLLVVSASPAQDTCQRFSIAGVHPGMTAEEVRSVVPAEGLETEVTLPDGSRASMEEYSLPDGMLHVEYDGPASRNSTRVALVRQPLRQTYESVTTLLHRAGEPSSGRDGLVRGLQPDPVIWVDAKCDMVLTYHRRETWYAEEASTVLRVERITGLPRESPAYPVALDYIARGAPVPPSREATPASTRVATSRVVQSPTPAAPPAEHNVPPRRAQYVAPVYPPRAKQQGVKGVVSLRVFVQRNGKVALARVTDADPPGHGFAEAAVEAAYRWKFIPAIRNGRDVDGELDVVVRFP